MHSFGMPNVCVELKGLSNTVGNLIALKSDFQGWCCILEHHLCLHVFIPSICVSCVQDSMEAMLFLRGWWVHCGWFSKAACPLHLGEKHREPGEDPARNQRRAAPGCRCKCSQHCAWRLKHSVMLGYFQLHWDITYFKMTFFKQILPLTSFSGIRSVPSLPPSPVEWCPSGLRTKS